MNIYRYRRKLKGIYIVIDSKIFQLYINNRAQTFLLIDYNRPTQEGEICVLHELTNLKFVWTSCSQHRWLHLKNCYSYVCALSPLTTNNIINWVLGFSLVNSVISLPLFNFNFMSFYVTSFSGSALPLILNPICKHLVVV